MAKNTETHLFSLAMDTSFRLEYTVSRLRGKKEDLGGTKNVARKVLQTIKEHNSIHNGRDDCSARITPSSRPHVQVLSLPPALTSLEASPFAQQSSTKRFFAQISQAQPSTLQQLLSSAITSSPGADPRARIGACPTRDESGNSSHLPVRHR